MKVKNETLWRTDHLRAILQRAAEIELDPAKRKVLTVTVRYTRGGHSSGCAWIGGRHATVRIRHPQSRRARWVHVPHDDPRPAHGHWAKADGTTGKVVRDTSPHALTPEAQTELVLHFASVAVHEFAHIRGMTHQVMPAKYKWHGRWRAYVEWAIGMPLDVQAPKAVVKPTTHDKLAHVLKMKARAETRVKRATTLLKKWKARERYYMTAARKAAQSAQ
jgi:hypothetical protein